MIRRWYPGAKPRLNYDWKEQASPRVAVAPVLDVEPVLPRIAQQREQDRKNRAKLRLPAIDWERQS